MSTTTQLLPGVDRHGERYRIRLRFPGIGRHTEYRNTAASANARAAELIDLRDQGLLPTIDEDTVLTLAECATGVLLDKKTKVSRKMKRKLRASGIAWWKRALAPWQDGAYADTRVDLLSYVKIGNAITQRAVVAPKSARDEHGALMACLRWAMSQGVRVDPRLLAIERPAVESRSRLALDVEQVLLLASCAPKYAQRLIIFLSTTGLRIMEALQLTDDRVDLDNGVIFIPAEMCKEDEDKWVELTSAEVTLLREQLGVLHAVDQHSPTALLPPRASGTRYVFPTKTGKPFRYPLFHQLVWGQGGTVHGKAVKRAAARWRELHDLPDEAETPFCGLSPHDLRATAITFMRDAGFTREDAAARVGHHDSGALISRIYDQGDRRKRTRRAIDQLAPQGLLAAQSKATAADGFQGSWSAAQ